MADVFWHVPAQWPPTTTFVTDPPSLACGCAMRETKPARSHCIGRELKSNGDETWPVRSSRNLRHRASSCMSPPSPVANYVGFVRTGNLLFVSGQVCVNPEGKLIAKGKLGAGVTVEQGNAAARGCAINLLAQIKAALGDLDKVVRVVRLGGFVNSRPGLSRRAEGAERRLRPDGRGVRRQGPPRPHHRRRCFASRRRGGRGRRDIRGLVSRAMHPGARARLADGAASGPSRPARPRPRHHRKHAGRGSRRRSMAILASKSISSSPPMARRWCIMTMRLAASPRAAAPCSA